MRIGFPASRRFSSWSIFYFLLFIVLISSQVIMTLNSLSQIRHEEIAESIRNVWWLQNRMVYDGISSNVGWYGTLLIQYNLFGFSLYGPKIFKLLVHVISLAILFKISSKFLKKTIAWIPLCLYGLSPTVMFFTTVQTSFGIDLPYSIISLYWLMNIPKEKSRKQVMSALMLGAFMMVASMSYPSFILYLPVASFLIIKRFWQDKKRLIVLVVTAAVGSALPLAWISFYLINPAKLFFDPVVNSGIFRGGGELPTSISEALINVSNGSKIVLADLFHNSTSYYFEVGRVEFSHILSFVSVMAIIFAAFVAISFGIKGGINNWWYGFILLLILPYGMVISTLSSWFPGIRRSTILIFAFYGLVFWLCWYMNSEKLPKIQRLVILPMLFLIIHHIRVYPINIKALAIPSEHAESACFKISENPEVSIQKMVESTRDKNVVNTIISSHGDCRVAEVYSTIAGSCYWNNLECTTLQWHDQVNDITVKLTPNLWEDYYFKH